MIQSKSNVYCKIVFLNNFFLIFRDSGIVDSVDLITETPTKESVQIKEPIKKITLIDDFESETRGKI